MLYQSLYYAVAGCSSSAHEIINIASSNSFKISMVTFNKHTTGTAKSLISQNKSQNVIIRNNSFTECLSRIRPPEMGTIKVSTESMKRLLFY